MFSEEGGEPKSTNLHVKLEKAKKEKNLVRLSFPSLSSELMLYQWVLNFQELFIQPAKTDTLVKVVA